MTTGKPGVARFCSCTTAAVMLIATIPLSAQTTQPSSPAPAVGPYAGESFARMTGDLQGYTLVPSFANTYKGAPFVTNRWGMRDQEYELHPPKSTYRIALLGSSYTMAAGVLQPETAEAILESRLNASGPGTPKRHYEILNFSVGGYGVLQNVATIDKSVFRFSPNAVFLVVHSLDRGRVALHLTALVKAGVPLKYQYLTDKLASVGVRRDMEEPELRRRIRPITLDILAWSYAHIQSESRRRGVVVIGIAFPEPGGRRDAQLAEVAAIAASAGIPVLSLDGAYAGYTAEQIVLDGKDPHLNVLGNRLIANRWFEVLKRDDAKLLRLGFK